MDQALSEALGRESDVGFLPLTLTGEQRTDHFNNKCWAAGGNRNIEESHLI